jgi:hypothetical protein
MKAFKPVSIKKSGLNRISKGLQQSLWDSFYKALFDVVKNNSVYNDVNILVNAIRSGKIYYIDGAFRTDKTFSNVEALELERLGAKFCKGSYYIDKTSLPFAINEAITFVYSKHQAIFDKLDLTLANLALNLSKDTETQLYIKYAVESVFKTLQQDLIISMADKSIPLIDISRKGVEQPLIVSSFDKVDEYYKKTEEQAKRLHNIWLEKVEKAKDLRTKYKDFGKGKKGGLEEPPKEEPPKSKDDLKKELEKADKEKEKARKDLQDFRDKQAKEAPSLLPEGEAPKDVLSRADKIAQDYTYNMDYWVKNFKAKEISKMREDILKMRKRGERVETVEKYLQDRWKVGKNKAKFLARNECGLASTVLKATYYQEMGCTHYFWLRTHSDEKRPLHLELAKEENNQYGIAGKNIFSFDNNPIIDEKTGQRGLPQTIYNCGCNFAPIKNIDYYINRKKIENAKRNIFKKVTYTIQNSFKRFNSVYRYRRFANW